MNYRCNYSAILGLHIGHDRCAALIRDGLVVAAVAEERLDRIKYSPADELPLQAIERVLEMEQLSIDQIDAIAVTFSGILLSESILHTWREEISHHFCFPGVRIHFVGHHLAHAYAVYYTSEFTETAIMIADGAGDMLNEHQCEAESYYLAKDGKIELIFCRYQALPLKCGSPRTEFRADYMLANQMPLDISIGRKYEQITKLIGFQFGQAGKTMGLSPYGKPLTPFVPDNMGMNHSLNRGDYLTQLNQRQRQSELSYSDFIKQHKADIAYDIQRMTEMLLVSCIAEFSTMVSSNNLALSGGVFLNCVANKKILDSGLFNHVFLTPASGDDGQAIGAAYYVHSNIYGGTVSPHRFSAYQGPRYTTEHIVEEAQMVWLKYLVCEDWDRLIETLATQLAEGKVFGILQGRSEIGPRALGNRSILASPLVADMKDHINHNIKYREDFRPFAPMVIAEASSDYFDINVESPYMLLTCQVRPQFQKDLPAITHIDGSARLQTVSKMDNPFIHQLLCVFGKKTGYPILLNTSYNTENEPIVESPADAMRTLVNTDLSGIILENVWVYRPNE